jgi:Uma2 family endonuclease
MTVSIDQYLSSVYEPERDYVDGEIEDRNVGEKDHSKVPDVAVYFTEPLEQVFTTPPFLVIEVLSPEDRWSRMTRKLEDYSAMGCPNIWILDPLRSKAYRYAEETVSEIHGALATTEATISLPFGELW